MVFLTAVRQARRKLRPAPDRWWRKKIIFDQAKLWILRIHAAAKEHGLKYEQFIGGIIRHNIALDRKVLSQLAIYEPKTFQSLAELAKKKFEEGLLAGMAENPENIVNRLTTQEDLLEEGLRKLRLNAAQGSSKS